MSTSSWCRWWCCFGPSLKRAGQPDGRMMGRSELTEYPLPRLVTSGSQMSSSQLPKKSSLTPPNFRKPVRISVSILFQDFRGSCLRFALLYLFDWFIQHVTFSRFRKISENRKNRKKFISDVRKEWVWCVTAESIEMYGNRERPGWLSWQTPLFVHCQVACRT